MYFKPEGKTVNMYANDVWGTHVQDIVTFFIHQNQLFSWEMEAVLLFIYF